MPRTTDLKKYPPEFEHLLHHAAGEVVSLQFQTTARAMRFRHRFYSYMKLIREGSERLDLRPQAAIVQLALSEDHLTLSLGPLHDSWEGELIRETLHFAKGAPTSAAVLQAATAAEGQDALKGKLAEIRARRLAE
jgi:hypothetical protein